MKLMLACLLICLSGLAVSKPAKTLTLSQLNAMRAPFQLADLPFAYDAIKDVVDEETMKIHHGKHHKAYVDNLNKASSEAKEDLLKIFKTIAKQSATIRNNGGGHWNHTFFWSILTPEASKRNVPAGLKKEIETSFGSWAAFQEKFEKQGVQQFGSGWVWLVRGADGKLAITSTANQDNPLMKTEKLRGIPIFGNDIWEHAYYLKYQNKRGDYLKSFWSIVNWEQVEAYRVESQKLAKSLD